MMNSLTPGRTTLLNKLGLSRESVRMGSHHREPPRSWSLTCLDLLLTVFLMRSGRGGGWWPWGTPTGTCARGRSLGTCWGSTAARLWPPRWPRIRRQHRRPANPCRRFTEPVQPCINPIHLGRNPILLSTNPVHPSTNPTLVSRSHRHHPEAGTYLIAACSPLPTWPRLWLGDPPLGLLRLREQLTSTQSL